MDLSFVKTLNIEFETFDFNPEDQNCIGVDHKLNTYGNDCDSYNISSEFFSFDKTDFMQIIGDFELITESVEKSNESSVSAFVEINTRGVENNSIKEENTGEVLIISESIEVTKKRGRGRPKKDCPIEQKIIDTKNINKTSAKKYREKKKKLDSELTKQFSVLQMQRHELNNQESSLNTQILELKNQISLQFKIPIESLEEKFREYSMRY